MKPRLLLTVIPPVIYTLFVLVAIMGLHASWGLAYYSINQPFGGFALFWRKESQCLVVHLFTGENWPGVQTGRLQPFDCIIAVDEFLHNPAYGARERGMAQIIPIQRRTKSTLNYLIKRNGDLFWVDNVPVIPFTWDMYFEVLLPRLIFGYGLLGLTFLVYQARPTGEANLIVALNGLYSAAIFGFLAINDTLIGYAPAHTPIYGYTIVGLLPFIPASFFHLGLVLPAVEKPLWLYRWRYLVYIFTLPLAVPFLLVYLFPAHQQSASLLQNLLSPLMVVFMLSCLFIIIGRYYWLYQTATSPRIKFQSYYLMLGWGIGVLPVWGFYGLNFFTGRFNGWIIDYMPFLLLIFAFCIAYATLRYQLFPGYSQRLKTLLIISSSLLLAGGYHFIIELVDLPHKGITLLLLIITTLVSSFFWTYRPYQGILGDFFTRLLHREQNDLQTITYLNEMLYQHNSHLVDLTQTIADSLYQLAEADNPRIWLTQVEAGLSRVETRLMPSQPSPQKPLLLNEATRQFLLETATPLRTQSYQNIASLRPIYQTNETAVIVPLVHQNQLIGLIALGPRWTEEIYSDEDLVLLQTMARQITLAILTAQQIAELRQYPERIAEAQEMERERLSQDLHDSTQQFLAALPFTMSTCQSMLATNPDNVTELLQFCTNHALTASDDLRAIRRSLSPNALRERGLVRALQLLIDATATRYPHVNLNFIPQGDIDSGLSPKAQLSLYRVIQQALDNALAHATPRTITITLTRFDPMITFSVKDDGCGFDLEQTERQLLSGHDGLKIMADRLKLLGSQLLLTSQPKQGTVVQGHVPLSPPNFST